MPLVGLAAVRTRLLHDRPNVSSFCMAGAARVSVPLTCSYANHLFWKQPLQLKHHQWTVLDRAHAERLADPTVLRRARDIFLAEYQGEPLCSDEAIPLLAALLPHGVMDAGLGNLARLPDTVAELALMQPPEQRLYDGFFGALPAAGVLDECLTFTYWPGCISSSHPLGFLRQYAPSGPQTCKALQMRACEGVLNGTADSTLRRECLPSFCTHVWST
jgi:hypothetical protein